MNISMSRKTVAVIAVAGGLMLGTLIGSGLVTAHAAPAAAQDATPLTIPNPAQLSNAFSRLAKQLEPSVVQVTSTIESQSARSNRRRAPNNPFGDDGPDFFRRFFGDPFGDMPQQPRRTEGTGSGFIVDPHGYILTNNHVVDGATRVRVTLNGDSTEYPATVVGADPELDLAVLKIDAGKTLPAVKIGNSDAVQVGDWAVAIGSPFGLEATVTAGIISAKGRALGDRDHQLQRFLQTDAAINPGNSGGPLLDINGDVIGVNTMIATSTGAYSGVGFALPINLAVNSYNQIIKTGKVSRGAIGIMYDRNQKPALLKAYGYPSSSGVFVTQITPGSPADRAGVHQGDLIVGFNGKPVQDGEALVGMVSQTPVGSKVPLTLLRDGKKLELNIEVGDRSKLVAGNDQSGEGPGEQGAAGGQAVKFGLSVRNLGSSERESAGLEANGGVLVTGVDDGSFADDLGIQPGDIITAVNRHAINSADDLKAIAGELKPGDAVAFKVLRSLGGRTGGNNWLTLFLAGTLRPN
jgi:serine protease Do